MVSGIRRTAFVPTPPRIGFLDRPGCGFRAAGAKLTLTAYARAEDRRLALVAGFTLHATKPVDAVKLIALAVSMTERLVPS